MRFFKTASDGGKKSGVKGFWLIEIKWLFSIVFLRFSPGTRENYHSHAFNALTIWLKGRVIEDRLDTRTKTEYPKAGRFKWTPRENIHRVEALVPTWCLCIRGPWHKEWREYDPKTNEIITLTHGRTEVGRTSA
jgi:hypothetical protein